MMVEMIQPLLVELGYMHQTRWQHIFDILQELGFIPSQVNLDRLIYQPKKVDQHPPVRLSQAEKAWISQHSEIRVGVDPEWMPIEYIDNNGKHNGISEDLVQMLNKKLNLKMRVVPNLSWTEVMEQTKAQQIDILPAVASTEERRKFLNFSTPYMHVRWAIVSLRDHSAIPGLIALQEIPTAVTNGYASHNRLTHEWKNIPLLPKATVLETLQAVLDGEAEAAIIDLDTATPLIHAYNMTQLKIDANVFEKMDALSFAVRKDWTELLSILNKGLETIGTDEVQRIQLKWMAVPVQIGMQRSEVIALIIKIVAGLVVVVIIFLAWNRRLAHEVKARKVSEEQMMVAKEEAETAQAEAITANSAKDEFLASMSHELRTPLTSIIGNSEYLKEREREQELQEVIGDIEAAGRSQLALVNDLLDMSKIQSGKFSIDEVPYDISVLLRDIEHMISIRAHEADLKVVVEQKNVEKYQLIGDGQRIGQILINLISNAIKFTATGSVELTTWVDAGKIIFQVKDSGIGMSAQQQEQLFQKFQQADGSISKRFGGTGLGLYISLNLAEMMGGTIDVSSQEGVGSIFKIILPYRPSKTRVTDLVEKAKTESMLDEKLTGHILIAEDTPELQILERRILEKMGLTVTAVANGQEAVDAAMGQKFDLILMDMQMPVMDGIEATRTLREGGNQTHVIALTANVMKKHRDLFEEAGCDDFLSKPIDRSELRQMLKQYLNQEHYE